MRLQSELIEIADKIPIDIQQNFSPILPPAGHERAWLLSYLEEFYNDQMITDILGKVRGGKEATVYCCAAHPSTGLDLIAAKVYRPRDVPQPAQRCHLPPGARAWSMKTARSVRSRREALAIAEEHPLRAGAAPRLLAGGRIPDHAAAV